jgi:ATP phosphoribosyltransferase regulatory subunit
VNGRAHALREVPPGVQCFVGAEARRRRAIEARVTSVFEGWDYEEIIPPLYDYADVFASESLAPRTYSFVGRDGSLLALRPDFTSLLAKMAAGRLAGRPQPLRLYYSGEVLRYEPPKAGRQSELYQMGLERLGGDVREGDAEVLAVALECLEALGVSGVVLAVGHVGVFGGLAAASGLDAERVAALRERVEAKDEAGVRALVSDARVAPALAEALVRVTAFVGGRSALDALAGAVPGGSPARRALDELRAVAAALESAGLGARVAFDLAEVRGLDYYTGLVFRAYAPGLGFDVGSGGRYDALLARFGRPMPAVGFMLGLDRLALLLERQGVVPGPPAPDAHAVAGGDLGAMLDAARRARSAGSRVRFGDRSLE